MPADMWLQTHTNRSLCLNIDILHLQLLSGSMCNLWDDSVDSYLLACDTSVWFDRCITVWTKSPATNGLLRSAAKTLEWWTGEQDAYMCWPNGSLCVLYQTHPLPPCQYQKLIGQKPHDDKSTDPRKHFLLVHVHVFVYDCIIFLFNMNCSLLCTFYRPWWRPRA